jgi:dethiobiotin synthetase
MGKLKPCNAEDHDTKRLCKDRHECARFTKNKQEPTSISFYHLQEHCSSFKREDDSEESNSKWESFTDKLTRLKAMWNFLVQKNNAVINK